MDKNYNVDDILSEIKRRKMREKANQAGREQVPSAGGEDSASFAPTSRDGGGFHFASSHDESPGTDHEEPVASGFQFQDPDSEMPPTGFQFKPTSRPAPESGPARPRETQRPPRTPRPPVQEEGFQFRAPDEDPPPRRATRPQEGAPVVSEPPTRTSAPRPQPRGEVTPLPRRAPKGQGEFRFQPPENAEEGSRPRNPMEFTGHVRPLTDRAKMRQGKPLPARPTVQGLNFNPTDAGDGEDVHSGNTRVLPKFSTGRELKLEEIQQMDFGADPYGDTPYYDDEDYYEDDFPASTLVDFSEYNEGTDRDEVALDIANTKLWLFIRAAATALLTGILLYFTLSGKYPKLPMLDIIQPVPGTMRSFMVANTLLTVAVAIVGSSAMGGGLISFFKLRANSDSLAAFAVLAAVIQGIMGIAKPEQVNVEAMNNYFFIAALAMLFNALGKMSMINRIQQNFRVLGSEREKHAVMAVESDDFCYEFIGEASQRRPTIAYSAKAGFFTDFLALSYSDKYDVGVNRAVAPVCLGGSLVVACATYFLTESMASAVSAMTAILCVCATLSATFIENVPLSKLAKKLAPGGGMVSGNKAVEDFCDTQAIILTEKDLFPKGHVSLQGIKAFSQNRIDEAILDAASVLCELDGGLAPVFLQMIGNNQKLLKKVDNIVVENGMGISAWVDSRRVLIGNRTLMLNHGITLPNDSYERGEATRAHGDPLYISNSGEVSARFLVGYQMDDELAAELDALAARERQLIIYTSDANITPHKLWEVYGFPEELVSIMSTDRQAEYRQMAQPRQTAIAEVVYTGRAATLVGTIIACMNARASILTATMIALVQIIVGYGVVAFMAFMGIIQTLSITELLVYQLFWFVAIFVIQKIRAS